MVFEDTLRFGLPDLACLWRREEDTVVAGVLSGNFLSEKVGLPPLQEGFPPLQLLQVLPHLLLPSASPTPLNLVLEVGLFEMSTKVVVPTVEFSCLAVSKPRGSLKAEHGKYTFNIFTFIKYISIYIYIDFS